MTLLRTHNLSAFYGDFQALFDIDVSVAQGETIALEDLALDELGRLRPS